MLENELGHRQGNPFVLVFLILLMAGLGFLFGSMVPFFLYLPFYSGNEDQLLRELQNTTADGDLKLLVYAMQASATLGGLLLAPYIFLRLQRQPVSAYFISRPVQLIPVVIVCLLLVSFMAVNSIFIEWNQNVDFPPFMEEFETWARGLEEDARRQTEALTTMTSPIELIVALFVIAVLPAVGEEFVFRGIIQQALLRGTRNIHVAIWISAILFSAIHMQFFGFVPRMLLGALFGYLFYWSGNLWIAILAHFINNALSVLAIYFYQRGDLEYDVESTEAVPANFIIMSAILTGGLLYYFYKYFENRKPEIN